MMRFRFPLSGILFLLILSSPATAISQQANPFAVRGRIVCLDEAGRRMNGDGDRSESPGAFALVGSDGKLYSFLPDDPETAVFTDKRVRQRELQITARLHPQDRLEIIKIQSIREGKLYDIYYFCEVCNITAYAPGLCSCCREDMEFRETPAPLP